MTPEEARQLLEGTSPAPWEVNTQTVYEDNGLEVTEFWVTDHYDKQVAEQESLERHLEEDESNLNLIAAAPGMAAMIAGMTPEYAMQGLCKDPEEWVMLSDWQEEMPPQEFILEITDADKGETWHVDTRIVCRYVTKPQPLGEEQ